MPASFPSESFPPASLPTDRRHRSGARPAGARASRGAVPPVVGAAALALLLAAAGCGSGSEADQAEKGVLRTAPPSTSATAPVPQVAPVTDADCPYLDADTVAQLNGEKVLRVRIDSKVTPPACFFYSDDEKVQLSTVLYEVDSAQQAAALVDESVPVATSERADLPGGWTGGKSGGGAGAMLAVARGTQVLVVHSAQEQTVKVQRIAEAALPRMTG